MVALAVMTGGVLVAMASFRYITQAITTFRTRTIATNLAQEKMEVLKNFSYFQLLVTTASATNGNYSPVLTYDTGNYAPETITLWGLPAFTRSVFVAYAEVNSNVVSTMPFTSSDPGMKEVVVDVAWRGLGGSYQKIEVRNLYTNPTAASLDSSFSGTVTNAAGGAPIASALVQVLGSPQWTANADVNGNYTFQVANGTYTLVASSTGFVTQSIAGLHAPHAVAVTRNFSLAQIATGTISGDVWEQMGPVISEIVASSGAANIEWVELFNPTTWTIPIGEPVGAPMIQFLVGVGNGAGGTVIDLTYNNLNVAASSYYLIASTSPITWNGTTRVADAVYKAGQSDQIQTGRSGGVGIQVTSDGSWLDRVAWSRSGGAENGPWALAEGSCIVAGPNGLADGDELVRMSAPGSLSSSYGRAYDTDNNAYNFFYFGSPGPYRVNNGSVSNPVITGRPSYGAMVWANDGTSASTRAVTLGGSYPYAQYSLVGVATGTWQVEVASNSYYQVVTNVVVTQGATTSVPNGATSPSTSQSWAYNDGKPELGLTSSTAKGFAQGFVCGIGTPCVPPLSNILVASSDGNTTRTSASGFYFLPVSTGAATITANFNGDNPTYTPDTEAGTITQGQTTWIPSSQYIHLVQGAVITGYVTPGTGALPNVDVQATLGSQVFTAPTDATGHFWISAATATSAYTVAPVLDPSQSYTTAPSNPLTASITVPGSVVFAGTITVTGAMGTITGSVSDTGKAITTGVLIVATSGATSDPPPTITASSAGGLANPIYSVSSQADGTYSLSVRGGTYNVGAYYPQVDENSGAATYRYKTLGSVVVTAGATTPNENFTWP